jgi:hypothetical protein
MLRPSIQRRIGFSLGALAVFGALVWMQSLYAQGLRRPEFFDGWLLLGGVLFLTVFNIRKKLPMLPLGPARVWLRIHIYVGYVTCGLFALHAGISLPMGKLDSGLWTVFLFTAVSGVLGAYLSKAIPLRLREANEPVLLERIGQFRRQLAVETAEIAAQSIEERGSLTISAFYGDTLHDFMQRPRNLLAHLHGSNRALNSILAGLDALDRYVDDKGRELLAEIRSRVVAKNDLDFQYANLMLLRLWLFVHVPATYGLLVLAFVHVTVVYAFSSGAP